MLTSSTKEKADALGAAMFMLWEVTQRSNLVAVAVAVAVHHALVAWRPSRKSE